MIRSGIRKTMIAAYMFIISMDSIIRASTGKQIDWDMVPDRYLRNSFKIVVGSGGAAIGADSLPVEALAYPVKKGTVFNLGTAPTVIVTVGVAGAAQGATSIPVAALSGAIPNGTVLDFGGAKFARLTANAAAGATALTVAALPTALVSGDNTTFQGGAKVVRTTADAAAGATSIDIENLQFAIAAATAIYSQISLGSENEIPRGKFIPAGTVMAELASGKIIPRAAVTGAETACCLLETNASSDSETDAITGYGTIWGAAVWENQLPEATGSPRVISSGWKTELRAVGGSWIFKQNRDSRSA